MTATELGAAPDFAEPLEGWRVWRVVDRRGDLRLASVVHGTIWPPLDPLAAECLKPRILLGRLRRAHPAPATKCECGIYGASFEQAASYLDDSLPEALARVVGRVALWGTVVQCERGLRASHAYPRSIYVPADACRDGRATADEVARGLACYGVPVELVPDERADLEADTIAGRVDPRGGA